MIYITGDCHRDFSRFNTEYFPEQRTMTKDDYVIILGDFGGIWNRDEESKDEKYWLNWLANKPFTTLFVDGNHENHERIAAYPETEFCGGKVHEIRPSLLHLMRGEIYTIEGKTFFAFGGASSHDIRDGILEPEDKEKIKEYQNDWKQFRINHVSWWKEELPSEEEMNHGLINLAEHNNKVDYILTHCAPQQISSILSFGTNKPDILTNYFDTIMNTVTFDKWLFGHYHDSKQIMGKFKLMYTELEPLDDKNRFLSAEEIEERE